MDYLKRFLLLTLFCFTLQNCYSQEIDKGQVKIMSIFLFQFANNTEQPKSATSESDTFKIAFLGNDKLALESFNSFKDSYDGKKIRNRIIQTHRTNRIDNLKSFDLLFVTNRCEYSNEEIRSQINKTGTIYVGYMLPFGEPMINLIHNDNNISYSLNIRYASLNEISFDSKLINLSVSEENEWEKLMEKLDTQNKQINQQENAITIQEKTIIGHESTISSQKYMIYLSSAFLIVFLAASVLIFRSYQAKNKAHKETELQKEIVDEKNREILDSINYAKRIQSAILPSTKLVKEYLQQSFILYKPKDIVAGDFYWMEHKEGKVLFAAADCTGHGVPGAMVSVVCNNALNRSVREYGLSDPGKILDKTREIVINEFEKSEEDVKDGMDIALCSLEGNKLSYAGAHNALWIIRNGSNKIEETKANKQPIGKFDLTTPYTTHSFELEKGDSVYIFSDGYVDQFGGPKGKKFKAKAFRELLLSIQDTPMEEHSFLIDKAFEKWRGNIEQIDDVCVIGIRI